jgi:flagellar biosynthesis protein FlhF
VGPTGSGKTATVAKLADRLTRAGRAVAVATLDSYRPGGVHVLAAEAERVGVPYRPCRYREDVAGFVAEQSGCDAILLDTRGRSPQDTEHVSQLASALTESLESADLVTYLVVAATASKASLQEVLAGFARTRPEAAVVTKVDETRRTAVALEVVQGRGLPIAFLCTGQEIATDFYRATPDRMADLVLGGRVR